MYKHVKTVFDKISVKGVVQCKDDGAFIIYEKDKEEYTVNVLDLFKQFSGEIINLILSTKDETDLEE